MVNKKYNIYCDKEPSKNYLIGYPLDFRVNPEWHRLVGNLDVSADSISHLHSLGGRWEAGIKICLPENFSSEIESEIKKSVDKFIKSIREEWESNMELSMIEGAVGDAVFLDVDFYLGKDRLADYHGNKRDVLLCCFRDKELSLTKEEGEWFTDVGLISKVGFARDVPVGIFSRQNRYIVDSCVRKSKDGSVEPQILIPHESMFNHDRYNLGRYDIRD